MIPRTRRPGLGPRGEAFPALSLTLSALAHAAVLVGLWALAGFWGQSSKVYVVNLVSSISALGSPQSRPAPVQRAARRPETRESQRPAPEPVAKELPAARALPDSGRSEPELSRRPAALPRPGEKEPAPLAPSAERRAVAAPALPRAEPAPVSAPRPVVAAGRPSGSPQGTASLSLDVSDFPYAWYLRQILRKVEDSWTRQAKVTDPKEKPLVYVEIQRDGSIKPPTIEKSSGSFFYDQAALRAIIEASPFPELPSEWPKPSLRVLFRFDLGPDRG